jgi:hypothetical protein
VVRAVGPARAWKRETVVIRAPARSVGIPSLRVGPSQPQKQGAGLQPSGHQV